MTISNSLKKTQIILSKTTFLFFLFIISSCSQSPNQNNSSGGSNDPAQSSPSGVNVGTPSLKTFSYQALTTTTDTTETVSNSEDISAPDTRSILGEDLGSFEVDNSTPLPDYLSLDKSTGKISIEHKHKKESDEGNHQIKIHVRDKNGKIVGEAIFTIRLDKKKNDSSGGTTGNGPATGGSSGGQSIGTLAMDLRIVKVDVDTSGEIEFGPYSAGPSSSILAPKRNPENTADSTLQIKKNNDAWVSPGNEVKLIPSDSLKFKITNPTKEEQNYSLTFFEKGVYRHLASDFITAIPKTTSIKYSDVKVDVNDKLFGPVYATPDISSGTYNKWTIAPELPKGVTLDQKTGLIKGIPQAALAKTTYTVTAVNTEKNSVTRKATFSIEVTNAAQQAAVLTYATTAKYKANDTISIKPTNVPPAAKAWTITPNSLTIGTDGLVSGKAPAATQEYTVTALDKVGGKPVASAKFTITVEVAQQASAQTANSAKTLGTLSSSFRIREYKADLSTPSKPSLELGPYKAGNIKSIQATLESGQKYASVYIKINSGDWVTNGSLVKLTVTDTVRFQIAAPSTDNKDFILPLTLDGSKINDFIKVKVPKTCGIGGVGVFSKAFITQDLYTIDQLNWDTCDKEAAKYNLPLGYSKHEWFPLLTTGPNGREYALEPWIYGQREEWSNSKQLENILFKANQLGGVGDYICDIIDKKVILKKESISPLGGPTERDYKYSFVGSFTKTVDGTALKGEGKDPEDTFWLGSSDDVANDVSYTCNMYVNSSDLPDAKGTFGKLSHNLQSTSNSFTAIAPPSKGKEASKDLVGSCAAKRRLICIHI